MAKKDKRSLIGYDPLAWMDNSAERGLADQQSALQTEKVKGSEQQATPYEMVAAPEPAFNENTKIALLANQTIQNVSQLHEQLIAMLNNSDKSIEIDASAIKIVDTATIQLLVILKQEMNRLSRDLVFDFPSDKFVEAADELGLSHFLGVDKSASGFF